MVCFAVGNAGAGQATASATQTTAAASQATAAASQTTAAASQTTPEEDEETTEPPATCDTCEARKARFESQLQQCKDHNAERKEKYAQDIKTIQDDCERKKQELRDKGVADKQRRAETCASVKAGIQAVWDSQSALMRTNLAEKTTELASAKARKEALEKESKECEERKKELVAQLDKLNIHVPGSDAHKASMRAAIAKAPQVTAEPKAVTTGEPGSGATPEPGTGTTPQAGTGTTGQPGAGTTAQAGAGTTPQPGAGTTPEPAANTTPEAAHAAEMEIADSRIETESFEPWSSAEESVAAENVESSSNTFNLKLILYGLIGLNVCSAGIGMNLYFSVKNSENKYHLLAD